MPFGNSTLEKKLLNACVALAEEQPTRAVPSPSSVNDCFRRNWFRARGTTPTEKPDAESFIAAESGRLTEPLLAMIVWKAGLGAVARGSAGGRLRELDALELDPLNLSGGELDATLLTPEGEEVVLEFKRKGVFRILDLRRKGLLEAEPNDYTQLQALMFASGCQKALYFAANWDRSALTANTRKWDERPSGIYAEWVVADELTTGAIASRAGQTQGYIKLDDPKQVPKSFDPYKPDWQCDWCSWHGACKKADR